MPVVINWSGIYLIEGTEGEDENNTDYSMIEKQQNKNNWDDKDRE